MSTINITDARANLFKLASDVNIGHGPIIIINSKGENAVLVSEEERNAIQETLHLTSIPGFVNDIKKIDETTEWEKANTYDPNEEW